jgi:uncharacterized circularly permuted ATP-grasp superfamily protein/uncharacterized alpha-E superfamily protein
MATIRESRPGEPAKADSLIAGYRPQPGLYDELVNTDGRPRTHWRPLLDRLVPGEELAASFAAADRYLKESGVFYRVYDDKVAGERRWPLSHVPIVISAEDWKHIKAGVLQRVTLLEAILADCYGPQQLMSDGALPAAAIAGSPEFLRPLAGMPPGARHLGFYAVDLGRSPAGAWWVIRDRAQAPSGAGYALENRNAIVRGLTDIYRALDVERVSGFFEAFRSWMTSLREPDDAGPCLLTPGTMNETYFEHAYLARHLGFRLVEGQDLTVRDEQLFLRTIAGLRRVGAIWRRVDGDFCDPLELNQRSQLGVPGLVQAIRHGHVRVSNALGSGLAEARALMGFLPALAEHLLGQPLALPNVATWWCGQEAERKTVLDGIDKLVAAPAFAPSVPGVLDNGPAVVAEMTVRARQELVAAIERRGVDFVGQEVVNLSTTPVWEDGRLVPRPFLLRVYVAATAGGWTVMPGGLGLIGERIDARAVTMQSGARSADVWVLAGADTLPAPLPPPTRAVEVRRTSGALPSRAADNMFWMGRYLERGEATLRVIRALAARVSESDRAPQNDTAALADLLFKWGAAPQPDIGSAAGAALFGSAVGTVPDLVQAARGAAGVVRDRFPSDAVQALDDLHTYLTAASGGSRAAGAVLERAGTALRIIAAVAGAHGENMNRQSGWRFLQLGLRIERAIDTCRFTRQFAAPGAGNENLDVLLELAESLRTYRVRYMLGTARGAVLDLVLLDPDNPRSLAFSLTEIVGHLATLPNAGEPLAVVEALASEVTVLDPAGVTGERLIGIENVLMRLSNEISQAYFTLSEAV